MYWSVSIGDVPYSMHTSYESILPQVLDPSPILHLNSGTIFLIMFGNQTDSVSLDLD